MNIRLIVLFQYFSRFEFCLFERFKLVVDNASYIYLMCRLTRCKMDLPLILMLFDLLLEFPVSSILDGGVCGQAVDCCS